MERQGLASLSIFPRFAMKVVAEAWNGEQALEIAETVRPDIVISDIRMPIMDGLTFAAKLKEKFPATHIIMMSGFEDFSAAKQALSIGAHAYLTKPLRFDELERNLALIAGSIDAVANAAYEAVELQKRVDAIRPLLRERLLRDLLLGVRRMDDRLTRHEVRESGLFSPQDKLAVILLMAEKTAEIAKGKTAGTAGITVGREKTDMDSFMLGIQDIMSGMSMALTLSEPIAIHSGVFACIAFLPRRMDDEVAFDHLQQCATYMLEHVRTKSGQSVTISISSIRDDEMKLDAMYTEAYDTMRLYSAYGLNRVYWYETTETRSSAPDVYAVAEDILRRFTTDFSGIREQIAMFFDGMLGANLSLQNMQALCCELLTYLRVASAKQGRDFAVKKTEKSPYVQILSANFAHELQEHMINILTPGDEVFTPQTKTHADILVEKAVEYMNTHYMQDISADTIAQDVFITPAHLRRVFKNVTGQTIQEYILTARMNKAREMLSSTDLKIFEVAQAVGYENPPYFNIVFKKYFGKTPGEYRSGD